VSSIQFLLLGAAAMLFLIALAQPRDRPVANFAWAVIGAILILVSILPAALLLAILVLACFAMFRGFRRHY